MSTANYCCDRQCIRVPRTVVDGRLTCGCYYWCLCKCLTRQAEMLLLKRTNRNVGNQQHGQQQAENLLNNAVSSSLSKNNVSSVLANNDYETYNTSQQQSQQQQHQQEFSNNQAFITSSANSTANSSSTLDYAVPSTSVSSSRQTTVKRTYRVYDHEPEYHASFRGLRCRCGIWLRSYDNIAIVLPCGHKFCSRCSLLFDRCFTCHVIISDICIRVVQDMLTP